MIDVRMKLVDDADSSIEVNRCTAANVSVVIDGANVAKHVGPDREVHDSLYIPVYPLAMWIVDNWWCLNYEVQNPDRRIGSTYDERHRVRFGGEGFSLPNIRFSPSGESVTIECKSGSDKYSGNYYLKDVQCTVSRDEFELAMARIVQFALDGLRRGRCNDTALEQEWERIRTVPEGEKRFCVVSALLGRDPYSLTDDEEQSILDATSTIDPGCWESFFSFASLEQLSHHVEACKKDIKLVRSNATNNKAIKELHDSVKRNFPGTPWEQGYAAARHVRELLSYEGVPSDVYELMGLFGMGKRQQASVYMKDQDFYHGLTAMNRKKTPAFVVNSKRPDQQKFIFSRLVYHYLFENGSGVHFASSSRSTVQKRSRAFSAELIAPSAEIQKRMPSSVIDYAGIERVAVDMKVPSEVVVRQIENHGLGNCQR